VYRPPSTSFDCPLLEKENRVTYPVPSPGAEPGEEQMISTFEDWLNANGDGVVSCWWSHQWGSSQQIRGKEPPLTVCLYGTEVVVSKVVADEIMCGLASSRIRNTFFFRVGSFGLN
jgi:hypothetical protein